MVVNVASLCGYTDTMYKALKRLQDILGYDNRFQVLAFPCNQFGEQEPYEGEQVYQFAVGNYGVEFPIFSKIEVIGEDAQQQQLVDSSAAAASLAKRWRLVRRKLTVWCRVGR